MSILAPVVVFAYRRPSHLRKTISSLMRCDGFERSPVVVYCDGPRDAHEVDSVLETRNIAETMLGERAEYHFSKEHLGLACSVIGGVSNTIDRFGRAIVVEDDLELSPSFLLFINQALDRYAHDEKVFQVSGYMFDVPELKTVTSALFLPFTVSWGWATWKRAWDYFDLSASGWEALRTDRGLRRRFNLDGAYDYTSMLIRQMQGLSDSWAIRWYWSVFKANGLVFFPPVSAVNNTGFDGSGTHGRGLFRKKSKTMNILSSSEIDFPAEISFNAEQYAIVKKALWRQNGGWIQWAMERIRNLVTD